VRGLTHELKTPIAAIRASGELLVDDLPAADRARFAQQVVAQSERLQTLVDRLLELSKLEQRALAGGLAESPAWGVHRVDEIARAAAALVADGKPLASPVNVECETTEAITCERDLLTLALTNVLENAMAFSPPARAITLRVKASTTHIEMQVEDKGPGVPEFALARLGERFYSMPSSEDRSGRKGSGLGLAIVKQIMVLHGGDVQFANTQSGFRVTMKIKKTSH
jgi:two-component system, OmpR family, sensor histidine kinase CreC